VRAPGVRAHGSSHTTQTRNATQTFAPKPFADGGQGISGLAFHDEIRERPQGVLVRGIKEAGKATHRQLRKLPSLLARGAERAVAPDHLHDLLEAHRPKAALFEHAQNLFRLLRTTGTKHV